MVLIYNKSQAAPGMDYTKMKVSFRQLSNNGSSLKPKTFSDVHIICYLFNSNERLIKKD